MSRPGLRLTEQQPIPTTWEGCFISCVTLCSIPEKVLKSGRKASDDLATQPPSYDQNKARQERGVTLYEDETVFQQPVPFIELGAASVYEPT